MNSLRIEIANADTFEQHLIAYQNFLKRINSDGNIRPALIRNMDDSAPSGLLYLINNERGDHRRWTPGCGEIALLYDDLTGAIVGVSAVEHNPLSDNISSGGNRCWLLQAFRKNHTVTNYLLNSNFIWTKKQEKIGMMLTFNYYNKRIYDAIVLRSRGKTGSINKFWSNWWNDCLPIEQPIMLHNTPQWAVIKPCADHRLIKQEIQELVEIYGATDVQYTE